MKTNFRFLVATFISIVVASCEPTPFPNGGDPNNGDNSGNNGNTGENSSIVNPAIPYVAPEDRIVAREEFGNFEYFEYNNQGLLAKKTHYRAYDDGSEVGMRINTTTYSYEGLLVKSKESIVEISKNEGEETYFKTEDTSNGRRTEGVLNALGQFSGISHYRMENNGWDEYTEKLSYVTVYTYNTSGNLIGLVERNADGYDDSYTYTWENGNPKTIDYDGDGIYNFSFRNEEYVWHGINIYWDIDATDMYGDVEVTGRDGMKFANLLDRVYTDPETGETFYLEMVYTFDSKGRVKTVNSKWGDEGEEFYDEEDAVTFYYGDEELPEPPVVPAYLVKQEVVNTSIHMPRSDNDENTYVAIPHAFMTQFTVKNIFSDGTYSVSTIENENSFSMHDGVWGSISLTKAEFSELRSLDKPEYYVSLPSHSEDDMIPDEYANLIVSYPHIGEIVCPITLNNWENPCYIYLYDPSHTDANSSGYYRYYKSFFTEEFLLSNMKVDFELVKNNEDESWEFWTLLHHVDINLWPGLTYNDEATRFTWHVGMDVSKE